MERRRESNSDWLGRILGVLGILIGGGASAYFYTQNEARKTDIATMAQAASNAAEQSASNADQFNARWNEQLTGALEDFKQRANTLIETSNQAMQTRDKLFQSELARVAESFTDRESSADANEDNEDWETLIDEKLAEFQDLVAAPRLRVAPTLRKPVDATDVGLITIKNDGDREAAFRSVTFTPETQFETVPPLAMETALRSADELVIRFTPAHNTATTAGRHGTYTRQLDETSLVPGNSYIRMRVEIEDSAHLGWGFEGQLEIEYEDGVSLTVPNARVLFVAGNEDSV